MTAKKRMSPFVRFSAPLLALAAVSISGCRGGDTIDFQNDIVRCSNVSMVTTSDDTTGAELLTARLGNDEVGQSIRPETDIELSSIVLRLRRSSAQSTSAAPELIGNLSLILDIDYQGFDRPADREITRATIPAKLVARKAGRYQFRFDSPIKLRANNDYWLRLHGQYPASNTENIVWLGDLTNPYERGVSKFRQLASGGWSANASSLDLSFELGCSP